MFRRFICEGAGQHARADDGLSAVNLTGDKRIAKRKQENERQELSDLARQGIMRHPKIIIFNLIPNSVEQRRLLSPLHKTVAKTYTLNLRNQGVIT